jgi:hypothetical protein
MSATRAVFHLARADFLERVRRYSFLLMLGLVTFLGYQVGIGNLPLELGRYRGVYNSAWVGAMMSLIATFFLGLFGFYLVKGSVARDRETGVGQILATTPLTRPLYTIGKWMSNCALLMVMVLVLALSGIAIQFLHGESQHIQLPVFLAPFVLVVFPMMALVAAVAVLFETVPFLSGGFGNIVYFFAFLTTFQSFSKLSRLNPALEPLGLVLFMKDMKAAVINVYPDYSGGFSLGSGGEPFAGTFLWTGIRWTQDLVLARSVFLVLAIGLVLLAALFFDRFDPSRSQPRRGKRSAPLAKVDTASAGKSPPSVHLTPLAASLNNLAFMRVLVSELRLLLKGQRWWWYAGAILLFITSLARPPETVRAFVLPLAWLWPILIWSGMGTREVRHNAQQIVFSCAAPLLRQLPATWLAGFIITVLTGGGAALKLFGSGDSTGLLAWISGAIFIPSLALASGVWTSSHKVFEVVYVSIWYLGPMNKVHALDYLGAHGGGNVGFYLPFSIALLFFAFAGRARQLQC